jgi:type IV fimbrial biogenesis protein FimT
MMIVLVIAAVLVTIGAPMLSDFVADQRVRTTASDLMSDIALARANAIEQSRRAYIQRTSPNWRDGWRIFVDLNGNSSYDPGEEIKIFDGFPPGNMYLCTPVADFATNIIFRPDGRIVRTGAPAPTDGLYVVNLMGDNVQANNKIRGVQFGLSGRPTVVNMNGAAAPC